MTRLARTTVALALVAGAIAVGAVSAAPHFPARIDLPPNPNSGAPWAAEGIFGQGHTFYAGDTTNGAVLKGDVRTGESSILVPAAAQGAKAALGVFVDHWNRLWVAGGGAPTGLTQRHAFVYDADTGALIKDILLTSAPGFGIINDVTVTKHAAYFTNTNNETNPQANVLFKVPLGKRGEIGTPTTVPIPFFGANGIEATKNGNTLYVVSLSLGTYYKIDTETEEPVQITLTENGNPAIAPRGDGLILRGHTLYAVLNLPNAAFPGMCGDIVKIKLHDHGTTGEIVDHLNNADDPLVNPATADLFGKYIYVIRRNFAPPPAPPCTTAGVTPAVRWMTRVDKHGEED
jgi:hypothetical protein